jgi:hypothetical protein
MMVQVEGGARPALTRKDRVDVPQDTVHGTHARAHPLIQEAGTVRKCSVPGDSPDVSRALASELIAELGQRPFHPTTEQLAWVWGGELVLGEATASRARIAACRYAALFAGHVVRDVATDGAPGAYARIWLCARLAFIESMTSEASQPWPGPDVVAWEIEGGTAS